MKTDDITIGRNVQLTLDVMRMVAERNAKIANRKSKIKAIKRRIMFWKKP